LGEGERGGAGRVEEEGEGLEIEREEGGRGMGFCVATGADSVRG